MKKHHFSSPLLPSEHFVALLLLFILGLSVYAHVVSYPFVHDDKVLIAQNPRLADWTEVLSSFFSFPEDSSLGVVVYYRPLLEVFNKLILVLFGPEPAGYHLANLYLHILNGFLVFCLFFRIWGGKSHGPFYVAALFLMHPAQTEAVACVSGSSNLLMTFFCLLSFNFYSSAQEGAHDRAKGSWRRGALAVLFFLMALLSKEQAIILPVLLWGQAVFFPREREKAFKKTSLPGKIRRHSLLVIFFFISLAYLLWRGVFLSGSDLTFLAYPEELWLRFKALPRAFLMYIRLLLWPAGLHYYRSVDILESSRPAYFFLLPGLLLCLAIYRACRKTAGPLLLFGSWWFVVSLLPVLNIIPLVNEYSLVAAFEHFLYFPSIGFFLIIVASVWQGLRRIPFPRVQRFLLYGFPAMIFALYMIAAINQTKYWRGEIPLFERAVQYQQNFGRLRLLLARAYVEAGNYEGAIEQYQRALGIMQDYLVKTRLNPIRRVYLNFARESKWGLAHCHEIQGRYSKALDFYDEMARDEEMKEAGLLRQGIIHLKMENWAAAERVFSELAVIKPGDLSIKNSLAVAFIGQGKEREAEGLLQEILREDQAFILADENLKRLKKNKGEAGP